MYHTLYEEVYGWFERHGPLEEPSIGDGEGFYLVCEGDYLYGRGSVDWMNGRGGGAGEGGLEGVGYPEGRLEMLGRLRRLEAEATEYLVEAGVENQGR